MPARKKRKGKRKKKSKGKRKASKKVNKPKRGMSSFMFFCKFNRPKIQSKFPGSTAAEVAVKLGAIWRGLDEEKKAKWSKYAKAQNDKEKKVFYANNPNLKPKVKSVPFTKKKNLLLRDLSQPSRLSSSSSLAKKSSEILIKKSWTCPSCKISNPSYTGSCKICYTRVPGSHGPPVPRRPNRIPNVFQTKRDPTSVKFPQLRRFLHEQNLIEVYDRLEKQKVNLKLLIQIVREEGEDLYELVPAIGNRRRLTEAITRKFPNSARQRLGLNIADGKKRMGTLSKEQSPKVVSTYKVVLEAFCKQEHITKDNMDMLRRVRSESEISLRQHNRFLHDIGISEEDFEKKQENAPKEVIKECVVCLDSPSSIAIQPCGHLALCQDCSPNFDPNFETSTFKTCPRCRKEITSLIRIY